MYTDDVAPIGIPPEAVAVDAVRLLHLAATGAAKARTRRAAERVHWLIRSQLDDTDEADLMDLFDADPASAEATDDLVSAVSQCARYNPDFARQLVAAVNSDTPVDPERHWPYDDGATTAAVASAALVAGPILRLVFGLAVLGVGIWLRLHYGPIDAMCTTLVGAVARSTNYEWFQQCEMAETGAPAGWWIGAAGLILAGEGAARLFRRERPDE